MPLLMVQKSGIISGKFWWWAPKVSDVSCEVNSIASAEAKIASMAVFGGTPKMPQGKELKKKSPQAREWAQIEGSLYLVRSCKYKLKKGPLCGRFLFERRKYAFLDHRFALKIPLGKLFIHINFSLHIYFFVYIHVHCLSSILDHQSPNSQKID